VFESAEQVGAEAAFGGVRVADAAAGEDAGEEFLSEIAAEVVGAAFAAEEEEDWVPVGGTEFAEGEAGFGGIALSFDDERPAGGGEVGD